MIKRPLRQANPTALILAIWALIGGIAWETAAAADLGGNCCADLEERVAELEATTVRKGNRRVSLTLSGQVSRQIMYWNDNFDQDVYSVDNGLTTSRFGWSAAGGSTPTCRPDS